MAAPPAASLALGASLLAAVDAGRAEEALAHRSLLARRCARLDTAGLSLTAGVHPSFDAGVLRQLDAVWHSVPSRVKQVRKVGRGGGR